MSRIGKRVLTIPANVNVDVNENKVTVKGPKGELSLEVIKTLKVTLNENTLTVEKLKEDKFTNQMHGTTNANIKNMIIGVSEGYKNKEQCKNFRPKKDSAEWKINPDGYYPYCSACH